MAITLDSTTKGTPIIGSGTTISWSHTCTAGAVLVVATANGDNRDVTSVTYNGDALTELVDESDTSGGNRRCSLWAIHNPDTGASYTIEVTFASAIANTAVGMAASYTGVVNSSVAAMHRTLYSDHGDGTDQPTVTVVDSVSGDKVIAVVSVTEVTAQPNNNELQITENFAGNGDSQGLQDVTATGGNTVMSWDTPAPDQAFYNVSAMALIPSAGGATITSDPGSLILSGIAAVLRVGSTVWLRYRK